MSAHMWSGGRRPGGPARAVGLLDARDRGIAACRRKRRRSRSPRSSRPRAMRHQHEHVLSTQQPAVHHEPPAAAADGDRVQPRREQGPIAHRRLAGLGRQRRLGHSGGGGRRPLDAAEASRCCRRSWPSASSSPITAKRASCRCSRSRCRMPGAPARSFVRPATRPHASQTRMPEPRSRPGAHPSRAVAQDLARLAVRPRPSRRAAERSQSGVGRWTTREPGDLRRVAR